MFKVLQTRSQKEFGRYFKECQKKRQPLVVINRMTDYSLVRSDTDSSKCIHQRPKPGYSETEYPSKYDLLVKKYKADIIYGAVGRFTRVKITDSKAEVFAEELFTILSGLVDANCQECGYCTGKRSRTEVII